MFAQEPARTAGEAPIDLNILPPEYRARRSPAGTVGLILAAVLLVAVPLGLTHAARQAEARVAALAMAAEGQVTRLQDAAATVCALEPTARASAARARRLPALGAALADYDPARLVMTGMEESGDVLRVEGWAASVEDVQAYAERLAASGAVRAVAIEEPEGLAAPLVPSATPEAPSTLPAAQAPALPGAVVQDPYEQADAATPVTLTPGTALVRALDDAVDVDRATLTVRRGYVYHITAEPLVPGTETELAALVDGLTVRARGSEGLTFLARSDGVASVAVSSPPAGWAGAPIGYTLTASESPADPWEPDDYAPGQITPGAVQRRTFHPEGDVDRLELPIVAGHWYTVTADDATGGAEPEVSVLAGGERFGGDGAGGLGPQVTFQASTNGVAGITVTNAGAFGPESGYTLRVTEFQAPPSATPTARTAIPTTAVPTPTAAPSATATPPARTEATRTLVQTFTPAPTRTLVPTFTPAPTRTRTPTATPVPPPTAAHPATALPTATPTATAVPVPRETPCADASEPDDIVPREEAAPGASAHTFCPAGDRDRVVFPAQPGHAYRVETTALADGVDTVLAALIGKTTVTNDDRAPGDRSSAVVVYNVETAEAPVFLTLTNNGGFGPASTYTLRIEDLGEALPDAWEPDLAAPPSLALGSGLRRVMDPDGDIDAATLRVEAGRRYAVSTCGPLAGGVVPGTATGCPALAGELDTVLVVNGPVRSCLPAGCQSDDEGPEPERRNSRVEFYATETGRASITVFNKGVFGVQQEYYILAEELCASQADRPAGGSTSAASARRGKAAGLAAPLTEETPPPAAGSPPDPALPVHFRLRLVEGIP